MLQVNDLTVRYGSRCVVDGVSFSLEEGQWLMLVGPNGAGKSTLIEAVTRGVPSTGRITLNGQDVRAMKSSRLARSVGVLAQRNAAGYAYTVEEVVALGRYAHRGVFGRDEGGEEHVSRALALTGLTEMRRQSILTLSGGEVQRTFLAQVFAQDPQLLILDEPANHLDLKYQQRLFGLIGEWLQTPGRAVLSVVHDLSLARRWGSHTLLMDQGRCVAQGACDQVMTPENLSAVYGMDVHAWMRDLLAQW